jgi:hypothetical protein
MDPNLFPVVRPGQPVNPAYAQLIQPPTQHLPISMLTSTSKEYSNALPPYHPGTPAGVSHLEQAQLNTVNPVLLTVIPADAL